MRRGMVRHGDPTTTGGFVLAFSGTMHDGGRKIALHGEEATCGHCKGLFKINGTGTHCTDNGRPTVLHGDLVLCPCGRNKVTAGGDPRCSVEDGGSSSIARSVGTGPVERNSSSTTDAFDQYFHLCDEKTNEALKNRFYKIHYSGGVIEGYTDGAGFTKKVVANTAEEVRIEIFGEGI
ncbi:PAAR domain-containing protein [Collimonas sp. NPDC087041]|uniref:PAAR domain-containing protein n=1 Tax=Collimonas sp. NPDC087041 TaxID=3363960 RepID=UPI0037F74532